MKLQRIAAITLAAVALTGCNQHYIRGAQSDCSTFGYTGNEYRACVERQTAARWDHHRNFTRQMNDLGRSSAVTPRSCTWEQVGHLVQQRCW